MRQPCQNLKFKIKIHLCVRVWEGGGGQTLFPLTIELFHSVSRFDNILTCIKGLNPFLTSRSFFRAFRKLLTKLPKERNGFYLLLGSLALYLSVVINSVYKQDCVKYGRH